MASSPAALPFRRILTGALLGAGAVAVAHALFAAGTRSLVPWFAGGIASGLLLRWGWQAAWPMPIGAALMALLLGYPLPLALVPALASFSGAIALAAWLERRDFRPRFERRQDVLWFIAAGLPAAALPALISIGGLALLGGDSGIADPALRLLTWWCHSAIALLLLGPTVATLSWAGLRAWLDDAAATVPLLASLACLVAATLLLPQAVVGIWIPPLSLLGTLLATIRRDLAFGSLYALFIITAFTLGVTDSSPAWVFALLMGGSALLVNALLAERNEARRRVAAAEERQRLALLDAATEEQQRIGRDLHDTLGQELTAIALLARALETRMRAMPGAESLAPSARAISAGCDQLVEGARAFARELLTPVDTVARSIATMRLAAGDTSAGSARPAPRPSVDAGEARDSRRVIALAGPVLAVVAAGLGALAAPLASPLAWVPAGIASGAALRWGWSTLPWILVGQLVGGSVAGQPPLVIGVGAAATATSALIFVLALRRLGFRRDFTRLRDVVLFVGVALAAAAGATGVASWLPRSPPFDSAWMFAGVMLLVVGLPFAAVIPEALARLANERRRALQLGALVLAVAAAMLARVHGLQWVALLGLLVVIVGAMRLGIAFASVSVATLSMAHAIGAMPILRIAGDMQARQVASQLWSYATILVGVVLSVQALLAGRESSERRLREAAAGARIEMLGAAIREQERIGRALQDRLGSGLESLSRQLQELEARIRHDAPILATDIAEIELACEQSRQSALAISHGLLPPIARDGDLVGALRALASHVPTGVGTAVMVDAQPGLRLPLQSCRDIYRIVQEALNNALKHANASTIRIGLRIDGIDSLLVEVADDGRGVAPASPRSGLGLQTMQYRAAVAGGELRIESGPGRGTRVVCRIPLAGPASPATASA